MRFISFLCIVVLMASCKKDELPEDTSDFTLDNGILVLCEGLFQQNNASVSWISSANIDTDFFVSKTDRQLGDTGNDMQQYGGKIYIVVNVSSTIEVMSAADFSPIKQIVMQSGANAKQPRSIAFVGSNAYVTCYDGYVDVIDTASLTVTQRIPVGSNPEGILHANGKLYVSNSGGLSLPLMDSTVSIIDPALNSEIDRITVGQNPGALLSDSEGEVYVISRGNYGTNPSRLVRIDNTDQVAQTFGFDITMMCGMNQLFALSDGSTVDLFDPLTETFSQNNFIDLSSITTPYAMAFRASTNQFYVMDAKNYTNTGYVNRYSGSGVWETTYHVGLNPSKLLFFE